MKKMMHRFLRNEDGNTVIDWVVLMAGIVTLGLSVGFMVSSSAGNVATKVNTSLESMEPATAGG